MEKGLSLHRSGRLQEADGLYQEVLASDPRQPDALLLRGIVALQSNRPEEAVVHLRRCVSLHPQFSSAHCNLGAALIACGRAGDAVVALGRAIELNPSFHEAHAGLGDALALQGKLDEAIAAFSRGVSLAPVHPQYQVRLADLLAQAERLEDSLRAYRRAAELAPGTAAIHNNMGIVLTKMGRPDAALVELRNALQLQPSMVEALVNLGLALRDAGGRDEAAEVLSLASTLRPGDGQIHYNLASVLLECGRLEEAIGHYRHVVALCPSEPTHLSNLILALHYHHPFDEEAIRQECARWDTRFAEPLRARIKPHQNHRAPERKLRVGYVSSDFRRHACAKFILPLLAAHDRERFELFCYAEVRHPDDTTRRMQAHADGWRSTVGLSDDRVAQLVRDDRIDVLVDLKLHTSENRLLAFALRPAPVQVTWLGYPGGTGLRAIDYRLSDPWLDSPSRDDRLYSEKTYRLPETFWCYDPLVDGPEVNALPATSTGHITFGCLNNALKLNAPLLEKFARVLQAVKGSHLLLLSNPGCGFEHVLDMMERQGVERGRVEFLARQTPDQYLRNYHRIDIVLDSFPYNGHTTSLDATWMGVPFVTQAGSHPVSRGGLSQLSNLALPHLATESADAFVAAAVRLAGDLSELAELRSVLRDRMRASPLMNARRFARHAEVAYREMWRNWCTQRIERAG